MLRAINVKTYYWFASVFAIDTKSKQKADISGETSFLFSV